MKFLEEEVNKIGKKMVKLQELMDNNLPKIKKEIDWVIDNKIKCGTIIEQLLDSLLTYALMGKGTDEFVKLNDYYGKFRRKNSRKYAEYFKEIIED